MRLGPLGGTLGALVQSQPCSDNALSELGAKATELFWISSRDLRNFSSFQFHTATLRSLRKRCGGSHPSFSF